MAHISSSNKKNYDLVKASIVFSIGLMFATFFIRNAILKAHTGRYAWNNNQQGANSCMLLDTKTGDCWGNVKGQLTKFNLRKSNYAENPQLEAGSFSEE